MTALTDRLCRSRARPGSSGSRRCSASSARWSWRSAAASTAPIWRWPPHVCSGCGRLRSPATAPAIPTATASSPCRWRATSRWPTRSCPTAELLRDGYRANAGDRCFHCKTELYGTLTALARDRGFAAVVDGTNADDRGDYRPGREAARESRRAQPARRAAASARTTSARWHSRSACPVVGRAGLGVPVVAHSAPQRGHRREAAADRACRRRRSRAGLPRVPRAPPRSAGAARSRRATRWPRALEPAIADRLAGRAAGRRLPRGGARSARLPAGQPERPALPAAGAVSPTSSRVPRLAVAAAPSSALAWPPATSAQLPTTLEDIDSVNFALGVRDFDPALHRPHPPGYPVYIALGKAATAVTAWPGPTAVPIASRRGRWPRCRCSARCCSCGSDAAGADARSPRAARSSAGRPPLSRRALLATLVFGDRTAHLVLDVAADERRAGAGRGDGRTRYCSASPGGGSIRRPDGDRRLDPAAMAASGRADRARRAARGLRRGLPLADAVAHGAVAAAGARRPRRARRARARCSGSCDRLHRRRAEPGAFRWSWPAAASHAYLAALGSQAGEDFAGVEMLYLNPTPRLAAFALLRTFVWPWDSVPLAAVVLMLAAFGARRAACCVNVARRWRWSPWHAAVSRVPPGVPGHDLRPLRAAGGAAGRVPGGRGPRRRWPGRRRGRESALAHGASASPCPSSRPTSRDGSPTARLFDRVTVAAAAASPRPTIAMHQALLRPLEAEPRPMPAPPAVAAAPRVARSWRATGRSGASRPVWFLADPRRTDLALIDPQARRDVERFEWRGVQPVDAGRHAAGRRAVVPPRRARLVRDRRLEPHARDRRHGRLMGRGPAPRPDSARSCAGVPRPPACSSAAATWAPRAIPRRRSRGGRRPSTRPVVAADPGFFVRTVPCPAGGLVGDGRWADLTVPPRGGAEGGRVRHGDRAVRRAVVRRHDVGLRPRASTSRNSTTSAPWSWRWMSERAVLEVPQTAGDVTLVLEASRRSRYFDGRRRSRSGAARRAWDSIELAGDFVVRLGVLASRVQAGGNTLRLTTTQTFSPAERGGIG